MSTTANAQALGMVARLLYEAEKLLNSDIPISQLNLILRIPPTGAIPVTELRKTSTITSAGVSRSLSILAGYQVKNRNKLPKYIEIILDETDRRFKLVRLTEKGRELQNKLKAALKFYKDSDNAIDEFNSLAQS